MDPVVVLNSDYFDWAVRNAALAVVAKQKQEEADRAKAKAKSR